MRRVVKAAVVLIVGVGVATTAYAAAGWFDAARAAESLAGGQTR